MTRQDLYKTVRVLRESGAYARSLREKKEEEIESILVDRNRRSR